MERYLLAKGGLPELACVGVKDHVGALGRAVLGEEGGELVEFLLEQEIELVEGDLSIEPFGGGHDSVELVHELANLIDRVLDALDAHIEGDVIYRGCEERNQRRSDEVYRYLELGQIALDHAGMFVLDGFDDLSDFIGLVQARPDEPVIHHSLALALRKGRLE